MLYFIVFLLISLLLLNCLIFMSVNRLIELYSELLSNPLVDNDFWEEEFNDLCSKS